MKSKYLIIGMGPAGVAAAEAIRTQDVVGTITLVTTEPEGFYSRPGLAYALTGEIPEKQLFPVPSSHFKALNVQVITAKAIGINPQAKAVAFPNGKHIQYDKCLIATGASARPLTIPGHDIPGVVKLDNIRDLRNILQYAKKGKTAVVVGGGITALEIVEGLAARGVKTHYFLRRDRYWSSVLDSTESQLVTQRLEDEGIRIHTYTEIDKIIGKQKGVFRKEMTVGAVRTNHGKVIRCDFVGVAVGVQPNLALAQNADVKIERGVLVDTYMRTSKPDLYAAGDIVQVHDPLTGKTSLDILWPVARDQGRIAGLNMAGKKIAYIKEAPMNVTRLAGLTTTIIGQVSTHTPDADVVGIVRGDSETWHEIPDAIAAQTGFDVNRIRLMISRNRIIGAIVMGDQSLSSLIQRLVVEKANIAPIREALVGEDPDLYQILPRATTLLS